jgi:hypothetical protein
MKKFDIKIERTNTTSSPLPKGAYVCRILKAEQKDYTWGSRLEISFDVIEGEYKDHFKTAYLADTRENKKWKGVYRLTIPDETKQSYDSQARTFSNAIATIEESNNGYHWDWNEATLKDKTVGVLIRDFEYDIEGRTGWATEAFALITPEEVRAGKFKDPQPRPLKNKTVNPIESGFIADVKNLEDQLPF